jgi:endonuclease YncB( thermonuclease family)
MGRVFFIWWVGLLFSGTVSTVAWSAAFEGKVSRVVRGDTVEIEGPKKKKTLYRLIGVDAPNKGEWGFVDSKKYLERFALRQKVSVEPWSAKFCVRGHCTLLAKVICRREDIALRQIAAGHGRHDLRHVQEQSTTDRTLYKDAASLAKQKGLGIWGKADKP